MSWGMVGHNLASISQTSQSQICTQESDILINVINEGWRHQPPQQSTINNEIYSHPCLSSWLFFMNTLSALGQVINILIYWPVSFPFFIFFLIFNIKFGWGWLNRLVGMIPKLPFQCTCILFYFKSRCHVLEYIISIN